MHTLTEGGQRTGELPHRLRLDYGLELDDDGAGARGFVAYEFKAKPGDPARRPRQVAPYHLRLDWLLWFAAPSPMYAQGRFMRLVQKLLEGDRDVARRLRWNPFPERLPRFIRALLYRYRFTTPEERAATGEWWYRELVGPYLPPVGLDRGGDEPVANPKAMPSA